MAARMALQHWLWQKAAEPGKGEQVQLRAPHPSVSYVGHSLDGAYSTIGENSALTGVGLAAGLLAQGLLNEARLRSWQKMDYM
jgi:hypothetical protein